MSRRLLGGDAPSPALKYHYESCYLPVYYRKDSLLRDDGEFFLEEDLEEFPSKLYAVGKLKEQEVEAEV